MNMTGELGLGTVLKRNNEEGHQDPYDYSE